MATSAETPQVGDAPLDLPEEPQGLREKLGAMTEEEILKRLADFGIEVVDPDNPDRGGWQHKFTFPDGTPYEIVMERPVSRYRVSDQRDFGPVLEQLSEAAANGDAAAAYTAWGIVERCARVPSADEDYQAGEQSVRSYHEEVGVDPTQALERYQKSFSACASVSEQERGRSQYWIDEAARLGSTDALRALAREQGQSYEGYQNLERAWQLGNTDVLNELARAYRGGWASVDGQADPAMGYAYELLSQYVWRPPAAQSGSGKQLQGFNSFLERAGRLPDQATRDAGIKIARELLENNDNCCIRPN